MGEENREISKEQHVGRKDVRARCQRGRKRDWHMCEAV